MNKLKIAMIGQKGMPARFGGVETHVEQIATRLAAKGHEVWAFCRSRFMLEKRSSLPYPDEDREALTRQNGSWFYKGVRLLGRPSLNTKHFDAATHSFLCAVESGLAHDFDIVHFHGIGPSAFSFIPKAAGRKVVSTVHALDWRQVKWGRAATWALQKGEKIGTKNSTGVIAVSRIISDHLLRQYGVRARYIPNGAALSPSRYPRLIRQFRLEGDDYILAVGRIIPDRGLHDLIEAFSLLEGDLKLVIVGAESPRSGYSDRLEEMADERVIFTGNLFGEILEELYSNCRLFVLASSVEGLPITVCEAMSYGKGMVLSNIPENMEVAGNAAMYYKCGDSSKLYVALKELVDDRDALDLLGKRGMERVRTEYNWDMIAGAVERFYIDIIGASDASKT
jgi:glycosyltransferase involved in cell wall biosynthesis